MAAERFEALCQQAREALADNNAAQARTLYLQALAESFDSPGAHYGLATACFMLGDLASAALHFKEVTRLDGLHAGAFINLGAVYNRLDQLDEAVKALRRGIQLDPRRAEGYYNLGLVYRRKGEPELAIQAYREATHVNPRMSDAHSNLANLLSEMGRYSQAIQHYKKALEIVPKFEKAKAGLAKAEAALAAEEAVVPASSRSGILKKGPPAPPPPPSEKADLNRNVDPLADGMVMSKLHQATIESDNLGRSVLRLLENEVEPAIKELSTVLLYPDKTSAELKGRIEKFEAALNSMRSTQRSLQVSIKKIRELGERLFTPQG